MTNKPNCMLIGAQHAGTSWLWNVLKQHPQTSFPKTKENHFFGSAELYRKGLPWYFAHFDGLDTSKIICDAATTNFYDRVPYWYNAKNEVEYDDSLPTIPELIVDAIPEVKIIVSLRDPVSRTISSLPALDETPVCSFDNPKETGVSMAGVKKNCAELS